MHTTSRLLSLVIALAVVVPTLATVEGCSSSAAARKKRRGAGVKGTAAKTEGQKAGPAASGGTGSGEEKGAELEGLTCAADLEGIAWCNDDATVILCAGGQWYGVSCGALNGGVCAEDAETNVIDCVAPADVE